MSHRRDFSRVLKFILVLRQLFRIDILHCHFPTLLRGGATSLTLIASQPYTLNLEPYYQVYSELDTVGSYLSFIWIREISVSDALSPTYLLRCSGLEQGLICAYIVVSMLRC